MFGCTLRVNRSEQHFYLLHVVIGHLETVQNLIAEVCIGANPFAV